MKTEKHWSEADKELIAEREREFPEYEYRVLRGSLHEPWLQRRKRADLVEGKIDWEITS